MTGPKHYNLIAPKIQKIGKPRGMGAVLRAVKLTISPNKHDANGHRAAKCLEWDKKTETFIKQCLQCLQQDESQEWYGFEDADVGEPMSATSAEPAMGFTYSPDIERMPELETITNDGPKDNVEEEDMVEVEI